MKKHILPGLLSIAFTLAAFTPQANAQIKNDRGTFTMPQNGDWVIETRAAIDFTGGSLFSLNDGFLSNLNSGFNAEDVFQGDFESTSYFPMLKIRKFTNRNMVHRMTMNLSYNRQNTSSTSDFTNRNFGIALGYGMEKIYNASERLNTYVGGDLTLGFARISSESALDEASQNAFGFGLRGFTGMDYFVLPKIYLGLELGYGISLNHYGEVNFVDSDNNTTNSDFTITPYVTPTFRMGYVLCGGKKKHGHHEPSYRSKMRYNDDEE